MDLVLRAFDQQAVMRAEKLPVRQLWTVLETGGMRDKAKVRAGLDAPEDPYARETVVARLESLIQEGYGEESLTRLRGGDPIDLAALRRAHWPAIDAVEAVELHEDLVRYLTYGIWSAPEEGVAHALAVLTGQSDAAFLLGNPEAAGGLQEILDTIGDDARFAERYGAAVHADLARRSKATDDAVHAELSALQRLLGPAARLLQGAREVGLRTVVYQQQPGSDGLTAVLAQELQPGGSRRADRDDEQGAAMPRA